MRVGKNMLRAPHRNEDRWKPPQPRVHRLVPLCPCRPSLVACPQEEVIPYHHHSPAEGLFIKVWLADLMHIMEA